MNTTELLIIDDTQIELAQAFSKNGLQPVLDRIREEAMKHKPDITTATGRSAIATNASNVAKSKTGLVQMRKDLVADMKARCKIIDAEGSRMEKNLNELKVEVRKPLTDWEEAEEVRVANLKGYITEMKRLASTEVTHSKNSDELDSILDALCDILVTEELFREFFKEARDVMDESIKRINILITEAKKREADAIELDKLRKKDDERKAEDAKLQAEQDKFDAAIKMRMQVWGDKSSNLDGATSKEIKRMLDSATGTVIDEAFGRWRQEAEKVLCKCIEDLEGGLAIVEARELREKEEETKRIIQSYRNGITTIKQVAVFGSSYPPITDTVILTLEYINGLNIKGNYGELQEEADNAIVETRDKLEIMLTEAKDRELKEKQERERLAEEEKQAVIDKAKSDERERIQAEQEKSEQARIKREADAKHIRKYKEAASEALENQLGFSKEKADETIEAIHSNLITNVTINY